MPDRMSDDADARLDASIVDADVAFDASDASTPPSEIVQAYYGPENGRCVLTSRGEVIQWTPAETNARWQVVHELRDVTQIACNAALICGRHTDGSWVCSRRMNVASPFPAGEPLRVPVDDIETLTPYRDGICALSHGDLLCWGDFGGHFAIGSAPTRIGPSGVVKFVNSGNSWSLIQTSHGDVYCWGWNAEGVCGPGPWYVFAPPRRIATGIVDVAATLESSTLLRKDGTVLTTGHVGFNTPRRKEHKPTEPEGDDFFYSDVPIPLSIPGRVRTLLGDDCFELQSGEAGCLGDKWYPRSIEELKPCRAEEGVVKCGEKVVPVRW